MIPADVQAAIATLLRAARERCPHSSDPDAVLSLFELYERDRGASVDGVALGRLDEPASRDAAWGYFSGGPCAS